MKIEVLKGDITKLNVESIVNPANSHMTMGGGLSGIIRETGGAEIEEEAKRYAPVPVGMAIVTNSGRLPAKKIIHAPTMEKPMETILTDNVKAAMQAILRCAEDNDIREIAIPGLGTGVGRVSYPDAARVMFQTLHAFKTKNIKRVIFVASNDKLYEAFLKELREKQ